MFVHSLFYNAFFEDPMTWGLIGLLGLATAPASRRPAGAVVIEEEAVPA